MDYAADWDALGAVPQNAPPGRSTLATARAKIGAGYPSDPDDAVALDQALKQPNMPPDARAALQARRDAIGTTTTGTDYAKEWDALPVSGKAPTGASTPASQPLSAGFGGGLKTAVGGGEALLQAVTGGIGAAVGGWRSLLGIASHSPLAMGKYGEDTNSAINAGQDWQQALTYQPRTAEGQAIAKAPGKLIDTIAGGYNKLGAIATKGYVPDIGTIVAHPGQTMENIGADVGKNIEANIPSAKGKIVPVLAAAGRTTPMAIASLIGISKDAPPQASETPSPPPSQPTTGTIIKNFLPQPPEGFVSPDPMRNPPPSPPQAPPAAAGGSVGAAAASNAEMARAAASGASPEIRQVVEGAIQNGRGVDLDALNRHIEAESLPVPMDLTKGQARMDPRQISFEMNNRGAMPELGGVFEKQNKQLIDNANAIRENVAPDVYTTTPIAHGEAIIDAYKAKDAALNADISAKYKALEDANGGQFPLDAQTFVKNADAAMHQNLTYEHLPAGIRTTLDNLSSNGMNFEQFEYLRTRLANIMRSSADGNVKAAASTVRGALEDLPMPEGAEGLKPLADTARAAARSRFQLIEGDPAYKAVVGGKATPDNFINKYVVNGNAADVATMKNNLAHDPVAQQTMAAGAFDALKDKAGVRGAESNFSQAGYNKALEAMRPKLGTIFEPAAQKQIETLGNVARYTQFQPRGSFVNNSNTLTGAMAEGTKSAAEGAANYAAGGVPVGTWIRKGGAYLSRRRTLADMIQAGAGIAVDKK